MFPKLIFVDEGKTHDTSAGYPPRRSARYPPCTRGRRKQSPFICLVSVGYQANRLGGYPADVISVLPAALLDQFHRRNCFFIASLESPVNPQLFCGMLHKKTPFVEVKKTFSKFVLVFSLKIILYAKKKHLNS